MILLSALAVYLGVKSFNDRSWSGWTSFSAQTLMSSRHWAEDGFLNNRLLFIPIGYSKAARLIDEPEMRHHARGTVYGGLIGKRLYYTHYPSGYLVPYALLAKAGVTQRAYFRLLSIAFSLAALVFLYAFLNLLAGPAAAFFAVFYYGASSTFLNFADSLANQPLDDMLRMLILFLSVLALREDGAPRAGRLRLSAWAAYLVLSLSSYDSTFFVFVWLAGIEAVDLLLKGERPGLRYIKRFAFYALAPVLGFAVQVMQNWWYLGYRDMLLDFSGIFMARANAGPGEGFVDGHIISAFLPVEYMTGMAAWTGAVAFALMLVILLRFAGRQGGSDLKLAAIAVLAAAAIPYTAIFSFTGLYTYQGRQWGPAIGLLLALSTILSVREIKSRGYGMPKAMAAGLLALSIFFWYMQAERSVKFVNEWPNNVIRQDLLDYYGKIDSLTEGDSVIFNMDPEFTEPYQQPDPLEEYYAGGMILNFKSLDDLVRDYLWLKDRSEYPYSPVIIAPDIDIVKEFADGAGEAGEIRRVGSKYAFIIRPEPSAFARP